MIDFASSIAAVPLPAGGNGQGLILDLTSTWVGYFALVLFVIAYLFVVLEEVTELRKSKPVMLAAALIWAAIGIYYYSHGNPAVAEAAVKKEVLDYGELLLFLIVSITYLNAMEERGVFDGIRDWLLRRRFGYRGLFWVTGWLAFFVSSVSNNMTTAMLMTAVIMAVARDNPRFVALSCVNTVIAVNAGGAFCPFGDLTTLMVWQKRAVSFWEFFHLFGPSVVNYLVPALFLQFAIPPGRAHRGDELFAVMKRGAIAIVGLFLATIAIAVIFSNLLQLPAAVGMMAGLTLLKFYGYYLRITHHDEPSLPTDLVDQVEADNALPQQRGRYDIFHNFARMEWDTLFFFYGVVLCVGALSFIGYLGKASQWLYGELGATVANVLVGLVSAVVDNIPVMFAILSMNPDISLGQWLLVTLTAGVGGSLLSVGSAAGIAIMGQARGVYTFTYHLRWMPAILVGYVASIVCHLWLNAALF